MKTYTGMRLLSSPALVTVSDGGSERALQPRRDLRNHSPDGFEWGYGGSGPAQLALALCADVLKDDARAQRVYQRVKDEVVAGMRGDAWTISEHDVMAAILRAEGVGV